MGMIRRLEILLRAFFISFRYRVAFFPLILPEYLKLYFIYRRVFLSGSSNKCYHVKAFRSHYVLESQVTSSPPHPVQYKSSLSRRIPDIPGGLGCQLGPSNCSPLESVAMARVEVATTQDNMEDLSWEKDDDNLLCGVLGEVETALGSSILVLAVSGPDYTTNDDKDDSKQQTGELFATSSQMSLGHPVLGLDVPHVLGSSMAVPSSCTC